MATNTQNNIPVMQPSWNYQAPQYTFQPPQQNYILPQTQQQQPNYNSQVVQSDRVWSPGQNAAKAYMVARNTEQVIWDSEAPVIYIKTVDAYGKPSMVTLDYTIRQEEQAQGVANTEVSNLRKEFDELKSDLRDFMKSMQERPAYKPNYNKKGVATND